MTTFAALTEAIQSENMQVFKFGGASVTNVERIQKVASIIRDYHSSKLCIVISAMGKTTNALEQVVDAFFENRQNHALQLFRQIREEHLSLGRTLVVQHFPELKERLDSFFTEVEWLLHDRPVQGYDYYYDQVVCAGELFSTAIISTYLLELGIQNTWIDVRDVVRTDSNFRDAGIDWAVTKTNTDSIIGSAFRDGDIVLTQGFIGATSENESTTLGREGSDYSAAVFANLLNADNLTIWKDVASVMNADPKLFPDARPIAALNYDEVIEMAYYGAQVIHPKTIKPLQNKHIPLLVKCFLDPELPGTVIDNSAVKDLPPIIVEKNKQVLVRLHTHDFSFIGEEPMSRLYQVLGELNIKPNLIQTGAVSLMLVMDDREDKIEKFALAAASLFEVQVEKGLSLLTIRHYTDTITTRLLNDRQPQLRQQTPDTIQLLLK